MTFLHVILSYLPLAPFEIQCCVVFGLSVVAFILLSPPLEVSAMSFAEVLPAFSFLLS